MIETTSGYNIDIDFVTKQKYFISYDLSYRRMEIYDKFIIRCEEPTAV
jgi:hypothetical protein